MALIKGEKPAPENYPPKREAYSSLIKSELLSQEEEEQIESSLSKTEPVKIPTSEPESEISPETALPGIETADFPPPPLPPKKSPEELLNDAREGANAILLQATQEAERLKEEAQNSAEQIAREAREEGFNQGYQEGVEIARRELSELLTKARKMLADLLRERKKVLLSLEAEVAGLAIEIAEKVIQAEVRQNKAQVLELVKAALQKAKDREEIIIKINPEDYETLKAGADYLDGFMEGIARYELQPDRRVEKGACIIESSLGNVDAQIKSQLEVLKIAFEGIARTYGEDAGDSDQPGEISENSL